jgi:hypothetical protein
MSAGIPQPLRTPPPPGGTGNPSQDAIITQQNMVNKQSALIGSTGGKRYKRHKRGGDGEIPVNTITPRYTNTMAGPQAPGNQQLNGLQTINQSQVQGAQDNVPLVTGGKKSKKNRGKKSKGRKSRKSRKSRKMRKSRKSRK